MYRRFTKELLAQAVVESLSIQDVARKVIGKPVSGNQHQHLKKMIIKFDLDTNHFLGSAHNRGRISNQRKNPDQIFVFGYRQKAHLLRRALIEIGIKYNCFICGLNQWKGRSLNLEIDHINGDNADNNLKNLRFLCPNCHSQTTTFGFRGKTE